MDEQLRQAIEEAVATAVKKNVNGKIDSMREEMKPVLDAFNSWKHLKAQFFFFGGALLAIGGLIQAVEAIWGLIAPHLTFK